MLSVDKQKKRVIITRSLINSNKYEKTEHIKLYEKNEDNKLATTKSYISMFREKKDWSTLAEHAMPETIWH